MTAKTALTRAARYAVTMTGAYASGDAAHAGEPVVAVTLAVGVVGALATSYATRHRIGGTR